MSFEDKTAEIKKNLRCAGCGAPLHYLPGTSFMLCSYCGAKNEIPQMDVIQLTLNLTPIPIEDYSAALANKKDDVLHQETEIASCTNCGASTTLDSHIVSTNCPFCASPLIIDHHTERVIRPNALLPFGIDYKVALANLKKWGKTLWFAPNDLKYVLDAHSVNGLKGVYIPYWSYNAFVESEYEGERGDYYYENRTVRDNDGKTRTIQERRTRWRRTSGVVSGQLDDILISASTSLSQSDANKVNSWNLEKLVPFDENYLSGFLAQTFQKNHQEGFELAKEVIDLEVQYWIRRDIGGDEQRIRDYDMELSDVTLRYILLPLYMSSYQYKNKTYSVLINAFSGRVYGARPYSFWKIFFLIVTILIVLTIYFLSTGS
jgi:LSD1 subclass zinc finger protein